MNRFAFMAGTASAVFGLFGAPLVFGQQPSGKPIRIGVPTAIQLQVGRDTQDAVKMAIDDINGKGGVLGRPLEMVAADETENPETGISAIKKLTGDEKVDVLIGGYTSGVTLAQLPHISAAKTIYLNVGSASPSTNAKVKTDYDNYKYIFRVGPINAAHQAREMTGFISGFVKGDLGINKIAIVGENAKWVQDLVPLLKKGATAAGADIRATEFFDAQTSDFSPLFSKIKDSGARVSDRDPVACVERHLREAVVQHALSDALRRHRCEKHGRRFLRPHRWQVGRRDGRQLRGPRRAHAQDDSVLRRVQKAHQSLAGLHRVRCERLGLHLRRSRQARGHAPTPTR